MHIVEVTVAPNGDIRVEAHGYQGSECYNERVVALEKVLGQRVSGELKPEYWNQANQQQEVQA